MSIWRLLATGTRIFITIYCIRLPHSLSAHSVYFTVYGVIVRFDKVSAPRADRLWERDWSDERDRESLSAYILYFFLDLVMVSIKMDTGGVCSEHALSEESAGPR